MGMIYFTADLHFGDKRVMELDKRPFADVTEMDEELVRRWNAKVDDNDHVYVLGDLSAYSAERTVEILKRLKGKKHFLRGNHDHIDTPAFREQFVGISDYEELSTNRCKVVASHYPIAHWRGQRYGYVLVYGHTHNAVDEQLFREYGARCRAEGVCFYAYNVGCMFWNYEPISMRELMESPIGIQMHEEMHKEDPTYVEE